MLKIASVGIVLGCLTLGCGDDTAAPKDDEESASAGSPTGSGAAPGSSTASSGSGGGVGAGGEGGAGASGSGTASGVGTGSGAGGSSPCLDDQGDCDGNAANGCETDLQLSEPHCGACGHDCSGGSCGEGVCHIETPAFGCNALAIDDANVYRAGNDVTRSSKSGGGASVLAPYAHGLALDATDVFYIRNLSTNPSEVGRVGKSGGAPTVLTTTPVGTPPGGVAVDATGVFWTELIYSMWDPAGGSLRRMPKAGGEITTLASGLDGPEHVAVDATHAYWTQSDQVMRVALAGGAPEVVASGQIWPRFVAVDATHAYWASSTFIGCPCALARAPLAGGAVEVLAEPSKPVASVTLDDSSVYWLEWSSVADADGSVNRVPKSGGAVDVLADALENPGGLAVDDQSVYYCTWDTQQSASPSLVKIKKD